GGDDTLRAGQILQTQGRFTEAEHVFQEAIDVAMSSASADAQITALSNLASVEVDLSRYDEAARIYQKAIGLLANDPVASRERIRILQIRLAELYLEAGQIDIAEKLVLPFVAGDKTGRAPLSSEAYAWDVLACLHAGKNRFEDAVAAERQSLSLLRELTD